VTIQSCMGRSILGLVAPMLAVVLAGSVWAADPAKKTPASPQQAAGDEATSSTSYWLGILAVPADAILKVHLGIDTGVVVEQIVPDSPAAKAEIQVNDILLKFGGVPLADVDGLHEAVRENKDREARVTLLRAGKEMTVAVKPEVRPADAGLGVPAHPGDWRQISEMLKRLERGEFGDDPLRMFFVQPGILMPKDFKQRQLELFTAPPDTLRLPKGSRVTVTRQHEGPAKITVEKDGQKWEVTEEELEQLPKDLRPAVKGMLGGRVYVFGQSPVVVPGERPDATPESGGKPLHDVRDRLEDMNRQLRESEQRMQKHFDELRKQLDKMGQHKD